MGFAYTSAYQCASATSVTIASNANKVISVALSALLFGRSISRTQLVGMAIALSAATAYSVLGEQEKRRAQDAHNKRAS